MTDWIFLLTVKDSYPNPELEVDSLAELEKKGITPYLLLAEREHPPGSTAKPKDNIFLCVRSHGGRNVAIAKASVVEVAKIREKAPPGLERLYSAELPRYWLGISVEKLSKPQTEEELGLPDNCFQFGRGRAYVRRLKPKKRLK